MKVFKKNILIISAVLLTGCSAGQLQMNVDPSLQNNSEVYEVTSSGSWWSDDRLNVSFGNYRVTDADISWETKSEGKGFFAQVLDKWGLDAGYSDVITESKSQSYHFKIGRDIIWNSQCVHIVKKHKVENKTVGSIGNSSGVEADITQNKSAMEILSSEYTCKYSRENNEPWVLSVWQDGAGFPQALNITFINNKKTFRAHSASGSFANSSRFLTPNAGYYWTEDNNSHSIAALSVKEKTNRVWLSKDNPDSLNNVLAMASVGLLIFDKTAR